MRGHSHLGRPVVTQQCQAHHSELYQTELCHTGLYIIQGWLSNTTHSFIFARSWDPWTPKFRLTWREHSKLKKTRTDML